MATTVPLVVPLADGEPSAVVVVTAPPRYVDAEIGLDRSELIAYAGDDGRRLWELDMFTGPCSVTTPAAGDVDGDGAMEIMLLAQEIHRHSHYSEDPEDPVPCVERDPECGPFHQTSGPPHSHLGDPRVRHVHRGGCGSLAVVSSEGDVERLVPLPALEGVEGGMASTISVADLDADGRPEIVVSGSVVDGSGVRWSDARLAGTDPAIGDIDGDGTLELVTPRDAFDHDGALLWSVEADADGHAVIARVLRDHSSESAEIVVADGRELVVRDGATGEPLLGPVRYANGTTAGPPAIADFDGDGLLEIGVMADHGYVVFDPDLPEPHVRWTVRCDDRTPGTVGASAFDFDADGAADVAYSDECHARILSGRDGRVLWARSNPSLTLWEYPVPADVDGDGEAELVVASNLLRSDQVSEFRCDRREEPYIEVAAGVRVFEDRLGGWGRTRAMWNEHGYRVDNVLDGGAIPAIPAEPRTWRASPREPEEDDVRLPALTVTALRTSAVDCGDDVTLEARVENRGSSGSAAGARVVFRAGERVLGSSETTRPLLPGAAEWVTLGPLHRSLLAGTIQARAEAPGPCAAGDPPVQLEAECTPL